MTKAQLVDLVARRSRLTKKSAAQFMEIVFNSIGEAVRTETRFSYPGFGTWSLRSRKARNIRSPQTNEIIRLNASRTVGFRAAKELKQTLQAVSAATAPRTAPSSELS